MTTDGKVHRITDHGSYKPDVASLARRQLASARRALNLSADEFAKVLAPVIKWTPSAEVIESWESSATPPGDVLVAAGILTSGASSAGATNSRDDDLVGQLMTERYSDVAAVYPSRAEFANAMPPDSFLSGASDIAIAGLSLNLICQQYTDHQIRELVENGTRLRALFLEPESDAMRARELEEGYHDPGKLSLLTTMNMEILQQRVYDQLSNDARPRMQIATYSETIRFNLIIVDDELCIAQPYLPATRGVDAPTFVIKRQWATGGMFGVFQQMLDHLWDRRTS
ncbi:DUF5919 domain-containing protein [Nocardioidaceae bacterium SCSIO 66511]|nr:DUF5919 domain-containing protein [Nocardioidaceae bacterium SCSIO 66511]